jgi:hypothetical protein
MVMVVVLGEDDRGQKVMRVSTEESARLQLAGCD